MVCRTVEVARQGVNRGTAPMTAQREPAPYAVRVVQVVSISVTLDCLDTAVKTADAGPRTTRLAQDVLRYGVGGRTTLLPAAKCSFGRILVSRDAAPSAKITVVVARRHENGRDPGQTNFTAGIRAFTKI